MHQLIRDCLIWIEWEIGSVQFCCNDLFNISFSLSVYLSCVWVDFFYRMMCVACDMLSFTSHSICILVLLFLERWYSISIHSTWSYNSQHTNILLYIAIVFWSECSLPCTTFVWLIETCICVCMILHCSLAIQNYPALF